MARKLTAHLTAGAIRRAARPLRLYGAGQGLILCGAWSIEAAGSLLPMALASSAALMLTVPLLRHLLGHRAGGTTVSQQRRRL